MKKLFALILVVSILLSLVACAQNEKADDTGKTSASPTNSVDGGNDGLSQDAATYYVYDGNGALKSAFFANGAITMTDYGLIYTDTDNYGGDYRFIPPFNDSSEMPYSIFYLEGQSYETFYSRVECNGCLYTLACVGDALKGETVELYLVEIDLKNGTGSQYLVSENGFYYGAVCAVNDKIILFYHDQKASGLTDRVIAFDPQQKTLEEKLTFELNNSLVGESVRYVFDYGYFIGLLVLKYTGADDVNMFIKVYNKLFLSSGEYDVTSAVKAAAGAYLDAADVNNEIIQHVSKAFILDQKYFYYENFSATRCLIDIESGAQVATLSGLFTASSGSGRPFFTNVFEGTTVFELYEGALVSNVFTPKTTGSVITGISCAANGNKLIAVQTPDNVNELYCI